MTDTELIDMLQDALREYGAHNFFMVSKTDRWIAVQVPDTTDALPATGAHPDIRGVMAELVDRMKSDKRGMIH